MLKKSIPVVVFASSGGWASILACVHQKNHITEELISDLMKGNLYFRFEA